MQPHWQRVRQCSSARSAPARLRYGNRLTGFRPQLVCHTAMPQSAAAEARDDSATAVVGLTEYYDTVADRAVIGLGCKVLGSHLGVPVPQQPTYDDLVITSRHFTKLSSPAQQQASVLSMLREVVPPALLVVLRGIMALMPKKLVFQINAWVASKCFGWLVGPTQQQTGPVQVAPGVVVHQNSIAKVKRCRYLEASGCVGMCVNLCKVPTQQFFTEDWGIPLTMKPNFEDLSCEMIFGQAPGPPELDPAFSQQCIAAHRMAIGAGPCSKVAGNLTSPLVLPVLSAGSQA